MKKNLIKLAGLAAIAGGLIFAQTTTTSPTGPAGHGSRRARMAQRISNYLQLTPDQQAQAKQIFASSRQEAAPLRQQMKQNRQALYSAIKAGNDTQIDQITKAQAPLMSQLAAIRAHAFEKVYATLTPDQKTKADNMRQFFHAGRGQRS